jgi:hypothetical protein
MDRPNVISFPPEHNSEAPAEKCLLLMTRSGKIFTQYKILLTISVRHLMQVDLK